MNAPPDHPLLSIPGVVYASPEQARRHLEVGGWSPRTIGETLRLAAARHPARTAYVCGEDRISFAELDERASRLAAGLRSMGLVPGDRALFQMGTRIETAVALFACFTAGILPVCTVPQYRAVEIRALAQLTTPAAYFVDAALSSSFDQVAFARQMCDEHRIDHLVISRGGEAGPGRSMEALIASHAPGHLAETWNCCDAAVLQLSGGSTGVPKIIPRHHGEYLAHVTAWCDHFGSQPGDVGIWALSMLHNAGMMFSLLRTVIYDATTVLLQEWDVQRFLALVEREQVRHAFTIGPHAPAIAGYPAARQHRLESLDLVLTLIGAESIERSLGRPATNIYGITEGLVLASAPDSPPSARHGSIGSVCGPHDEIRVLAPGTETPVEFGAVGELCFRGPSSLRGYFAAPEITAESLTSDGFFRTADMVRASHVGERVVYHFEGRMRDNINRGGEKFGTDDIELLIARHPAIADGKVVAMPDAQFGEKACAFVVAREGAVLPTVKELGAFLQSQGLAKYKCPERIEPIASFPITRVGKLDRQQMRQWIAAQLEFESIEVGDRG